MTGVRRPQLVLMAIVVTVLAIDALTKSVAVHVVGDRTAGWGPVSLDVVRNTGGPFGLGTSFPVAWLLLTAAAAAAAVGALVRVDRLDGVTVAAAVVAGGVLGNLVDRFARRRTGGATGVVDWITIDPYPYAFNIADVALRLGAIALIVAAWRRSDSVTTGVVAPDAEPMVASTAGPHVAPSREH